MINLWNRIKHFFSTFGSKKVPAIENSGESTTPPVANSPVQKKQGIYINSLDGATTYEQDMIAKVVPLINNAWVSEDLKNKILSHKKLDDSIGFECTNDSCQQIWDKMQKCYQDGIGLDDEIYYKAFTKVIGYESPDGTIHQNRKYLDSFDLSDIGDNLSHEGLHKIGYEHNGNYPTPENLASAPYAIGSMIGEIIAST